MSDPTQDNRPISISTPLGKDVLLLRSFKFHDALCRPFEMEMELQSTQDDINFDDIVGQNVTVTINLPNYQKRYVNGFIAEFEQTGYSEGTTYDLANYRAVMVPWVWMLSRSANSKIHKNKTAIQIIDGVASAHGFTAITDRTTANYPVLDFCVQYDETDLNFITRLMEREGIYYYFEHTATEATMILCDGPAAHVAYPGYSSVPYNSQRETLNVPEHIFDWRVRQEVQSAMCELDDYDYTKPQTSLLKQGDVTQNYNNGNYRRFHYPGGYKELDVGQQLAEVRIQSLQSRQTVQRAVGNVLGLCVGYKFSLTSYPREDQNTEYLNTEVDLELVTSDFATGTGAPSIETQECRSKMIELTRPFRPARITPRPFIRGPQTATVVGGADKQVDTDKYGNVYVTFHWDRNGRNDPGVDTSHDDQSIAIRVSQNWAGDGWGGMFIPHIGTEVVVSFEDGDPDRPLVTGRVYNETKLPPENPSSEPYLSYITDSSKKNAFTMEATTDQEKLALRNAKNELLMDSTKGAEKITVSDGQNSVVWDPVKGKVTTNNAKEASHWTWGKWDEWTGGIKNSVVIGLYIKLYQGSEFGITTGNKTAIVLGPEVKYNSALLGGFANIPILNCAKCETYSGNVYKVIYGTEYKVETTSRKKLNGTDHEELNTRWKALFGTQEVVAAVKSAEKVAGQKQIMASVFNRTTAGAETSTVGGTSTETITGTKTLTAVGGITMTGQGTGILNLGANTSMTSAGSMVVRGGVIALN